MFAKWSAWVCCSLVCICLVCFVALVLLLFKNFVAVNEFNGLQPNSEECWGFYEECKRRFNVKLWNSFCVISDQIESWEKSGALSLDVLTNPEESSRMKFFPAFAAPKAFAALRKFGITMNRRNPLGICLWFIRIQFGILLNHYRGIIATESSSLWPGLFQLDACEDLRDSENTSSRRLEFSGAADSYLSIVNFG